MIMAIPETGDKPWFKQGKRNQWIKKQMSFKQPNEHPKHRIAKCVIIWSFLAAIIITILVAINYWAFRDCENKIPDITSDLRVIWEIVTPLITLVLGYEFGRNEK